MSRASVLMEAGNVCGICGRRITMIDKFYAVPIIPRRYVTYRTGNPKMVLCSDCHKHMEGVVLFPLNVPYLTDKTRKSIETGLMSLLINKFRSEYYIGESGTEVGVMSMVFKDGSCMVYHRILEASMIRMYYQDYFDNQNIVDMLENSSVYILKSPRGSVLGVVPFRSVEIHGHKCNVVIENPLVLHVNDFKHSGEMLKEFLKRLKKLWGLRELECELIVLDKRSLRREWVRLGYELTGEGLKLVI